MRCRAEVFLQLDLRGARKIRRETPDEREICAAPAIDALIVIPDDE
jgi:hypothetical protein